MSICTFFGHHDCSAEAKPKLRELLIDLIENQSVDMFYVGNKGAFDALVCSVLRELVREYPRINYTVVLERLPAKQNKDYTIDYSDTMLPEGIENVSPRFAISWRNRWMLRKADVVIAYVRHSFGGTAHFAEMAERQGKTVIKL